MKKINFAIYNYNFLRIIEPNKQLQMEFPEWQVVDVEESFNNRQFLLGDILLSDYNTPYQFENAKKKKYWHVQVVKPQDEVYVMRVANVTNVTITDEHLKSKNYADYRNCLVIIDNRPGIQRIAIERKTKAFSDTKTVAGILEASLCKLLRQKLLKVKLTAVYGTNVFWTTLNDYPDGFRKVRFHFPHLNLERLTKVMDKYLKTAREDWDSDLDFSFGANEGGVVKIDSNNERQRALVEGASGGGVWIEMYPKGKRRPVFCGKNQFVVMGVDSKVFEELVSNEQVIPEVGQSAMDKVKLFMKQIPDVFNNQDSTD
mgnify:FL=1